ncbi:MAG: TonB-dependent receptor [Ignavibacteriales bacterium]|nr:TonB-dependent receptor [Ignavibacteriales bacterium]
MVLCNNKLKFIFYAILSLTLTFSSSNIFAGSTGKIGGKVTDGRTGEPLFGVNVVVLNGGGQGAATDINGEYLIINLLPDSYTLRFSMIGYKTVEISDVRVFTDRTVSVNMELEEALIEGEVVLVVAEREAVELDRTNTASYVNSDEIESLPVSTLDEVIQLQAGVVTDAGGGLHIRGGRSREISYMIDGVPVTNTFSQSGGSNVNVENNFIQELQVITGTFNAEYGSAQSGVINVVTKVPEQNFSGTIEALTGGYYSPNSPMYVGGLDKYDIFDEREVKFSISAPFNFFPESLGKLGFLFNGRIEDSKGYLNGERRYMPEDGWEIAVYKEWYQARFDPEDPLVIPLPDSLHSGDGSIVPMETLMNYNFNTKMVYQPIAGLTASYSIFYSNTKETDFSNTWKFIPDGIPTWYSDNITHMFVLTHSPYDNFYYNLRYSYQINHEKEYMYESATDPRYQKTAVNVWDPGANSGFDYGGIQSWDRSWFDQYIQLINGDLTWQVNKVVELKLGFEGKIYDLFYKNSPMKEELGHEMVQFPYTRSEIRSFEIPWEEFKEATRNYEFGNIKLRETHPDSAADDLFYINYNRQPVEGAAFAQTTLNMGEIVLNAGLRFDYFDPKDRYAPTYINVLPELVGDSRYYTDAKAKYQLSPRLGLSFPISDGGALRLSYGHFFQTPSYEKMFDNPVLSHYNQFSIANTTIGNPNLKPEKTIQYEIGLQQALTEELAMELSVYYKDIRDLLGVELLTLSNATSFRRYINKEYGHSTGVTFALNYRSNDGRFSGGLDYTYMVAKGTSSSAEAALDIQILSGPSRGAYTLAAKNVEYLDWDQTHSLNASFSVRPWDKTLFSVIGRIGSALPYTPSTIDYALELPAGWWSNIERRPLRWNVDMKLSKGFELLGLDFLASLNVYNVFNHLEENIVNSLTGRAGANAYLPEIAKRRYERIAQVGEFTKNETDYNPEWYSRPRFIQLGLALQF